MSRRNKVNPDHYTMAGRLAPDDLARERRNWPDQTVGRSRGDRKKPLPPWMTTETPKPAPDGMGDDDRASAAADDHVEASEASTVDEERDTASAPAQLKQTPGRTRKAAGARTAPRTTKTARARSASAPPSKARKASARSSSTRLRCRSS